MVKCGINRFMKYTFYLYTAVWKNTSHLLLKMYNMCHFNGRKSTLLNIRNNIITPRKLTMVM